MKAGFYWSYPIRSLVRGGRYSVLALFCITVGVMAIVALQLVGNMVNNGLTDNIRASNGGDVSVHSNQVPLSSQQLTIFDQLKTRGQITDYNAIAQSQGQSVDKNGQSQVYTVLAVDPAKFPLSGTPEFVTPNNGDLHSLLTGTNLVVTQSLMTTLNAQIGDNVTIHTTGGRVIDGKISGVIQNSGLFQGDEALVALDTFIALSNPSGQPVTYAAVYVTVPDHADANADAAKKSISDALPLATVTTTKDALQQNKDQVQLIRYFLQVVGLLALLIGGVGIINTMQVLLRRRQTEIAILKTIGYGQRHTSFLFGIEAGVLGIIGGVIGAALGVGISFLVKSLAEKALTITLPGDIDPLTIASGIAIGFFTALIFSLIPIIQAGQFRPVEVLRGFTERAGKTSKFLSLMLVVFLIILFSFMTMSIVRNTWVALGIVFGGGIFLLLLTLSFALIAAIIGRLPVPQHFSWRFIVLIGVALVISALITVVVPAFGILFLAASLIGIAIVLLPRASKANAKMAVRNIGRQKARMSTTMVALFVGVFSIGLVLSLTQNIRSETNAVLAAQVKYNSFIFVGNADKSLVDQQLSQILGIEGQTINPVVQEIPIAVRGVPLAQLLQGIPENGSTTSTGRQGAIFFLSGVEGYDLAHGVLPTQQIVRGKQDSHVGRNLGPQDANPNADGSYNVLMPQSTAALPLKLKLNDQLTLGSSDGKARVTVTVVGFYPTTVFGTSLPIYSDVSLVNVLSGGKPLYIYSLNFDPALAHQKLQQIQRAVPSVQVFAVVDLLGSLNSLLNNIVIMATAVASLTMLAGLIIIANVVALTMLERRRELGILKSVGYTSGSVLSEVLMENGIIGFTAALLAMLLVTLVTVVLTKFIFNTTLGISVPIVLGVMLATVVVCMLIGGFVASGATRVRPAEVLRYE